MKKTLVEKEAASESEPQGQNNRKPLSLQEAIAMLPDGNDIHTFRSDIPGMLIGADWRRKEVVALIEKHGAELSGESATAMNHGLWVNDGRGRGLFVETRKDSSVPDTSKSSNASEYSNKHHEPTNERYYEDMLRRLSTT